jgi:hypothetical protein
LTVARRPVAFPQSILFADKFTILRAAIISLTLKVVDPGPGIDPDQSITLTGKLRWRSMIRSLGNCAAPQKKLSASIDAAAKFLSFILFLP